jgi:uncharacterized membrane protein YeiH
MLAILKLIEILGIFAFAITGIIEARRKQMDIIGTYSVAMITAFGGGTLRDLLINRYPMFWIENYTYPILILALSVISIFILRKKSSFGKPVLFILNALDALALGLFSAVGTSYAIGMGVHWFTAVLIGVVTGVFGGVLRDIICNEVPVVFTQSQLYATCSFLGSLSFVIMINFFPYDSVTPLVSCIAITAILRFLSIRYNIQLKF